MAGRQPAPSTEHGAAGTAGWQLQLRGDGQLRPQPSQLRLLHLLVLPDVCACAGGWCGSCGSKPIRPEPASAVRQGLRAGVRADGAARGGRALAEPAGAAGPGPNHQVRPALTAVCGTCWVGRNLCLATRCAPRLRPYVGQAGLGATCVPPTGASLGRYAWQVG